MGRSRTDWATRCQTWVWYWALRQRSPLSDDGLDELVRKVSTPLPLKRRKKRKVIGRTTVDVDLRRRIFNRIKHFAYVPRHRKYRGKAMSVVDILEERISGSALIHKSRLWELLRTPRPALDRIRAIRDEVAAVHGLRLLTPQEKSVLETLNLSGLMMPNATKGSIDKHFIQDFSNNVDADTLTFLSCLYIEAVTMSWLEEAIYFRTMLYDAIHGFIRRYSIPNPAQALLQYLMDERVVKNLHGQENIDSESHFSRALALDTFGPKLSLAQIRPVVLATLSGDPDFPDWPHFHWIRVTRAANTFFQKYSLLNREAFRQVLLEDYKKTQRAIAAGENTDDPFLYSKVKAGKPDKRAIEAIRKVRAQIKKKPSGL